MSPKYFCEYMHITDMEPAEPIVVPKGAEIKPKNGRVQQNTVTTQKTEQTIQAPVLKPIEYGGFDLNVTIVTILKTLSDVSKKQYYGASTLVDILRGSKSKKIQTAKLNKINGYGKLSAIKREDVEFLVDWLIENGFILKTKGPYPVLHPTYNGNHYSEIITRQKLQSLKRKLESTESTI